MFVLWRWRIQEEKYLQLQVNVTGEIIAEERGTNGFGYDPLFFFPHLGKTMAELNLDEKNQISHRALAIKAIIPRLSGLLSG